MRKLIGRAASVTAAAVGVVALGALPALAGTSTSGWSSDGETVGIGSGVGIPDAYTNYDTGQLEDIWLGPRPAGWASNEPSLDTDLWCVEDDQLHNPSGASYSWSTNSNAELAYLMWLSEHNWNNAVGHGAIAYLLWDSGLNSTSSTWAFKQDRLDDGYQASLHWRNTTGPSLVSSFNSLSSYTNTAHVLEAVITSGSMPTEGVMNGIGVQDAWGDYIAGLSYTITITGGAATFDSNGGTSVTGTTGSSLRNGVHAWTASDNGEVTFEITYYDAAPGNTRVGTNATYQDLIGGVFGNLVMSDPAVQVEAAFQPAGASSVSDAHVLQGETVTDSFTPAAVGGSWLIDDGAYVPATYAVTAYFVPDTTVVPAGTTTIPAEAVELGSSTFTGTPSDTLTFEATSPADQTGVVTFVWSFIYADQPAEYQAFFTGEDWTDGLFAANESSQTYCLHTTATDGYDGDKEISNAGIALLDDAVDYCGLNPGDVYELQGVVYDKATGEPLLVDDAEVWASSTFTPTESDATEVVGFEFDASELPAGGEYVVFEYLYDDEGNLLVSHEDLEDEGQTFTVGDPWISTTATDGADGDKLIDLITGAVIEDEVCYGNLIPGTEYTLGGVQMDKSTGEALLVGGEAVTSTMAFTPTETTGCVVLPFEFDASGLTDGTALVTFEQLVTVDAETDETVVVATHEDITDDGQTVTARIAVAAGGAALAATGASTATPWIAGGAGGLLLVGASLMLVTRRPRISGAHAAE